MGIVSGLAGAGASIYGASLESDAANNAQQMQWKMFQQMRGDLSPFMTGGQNAFTNLSNLMGQGGPNASANMLEGLKNYPGYQFALQQGQQGLDRSLAARGLGLSGGSLKDSASYNQGMATNLFGNYFNQLMGMSQLGEGAAAGVGQAGMNAATNAGNYGMAGAGAWANGIGNAANSLFGQNGAMGNAMTEYGANWGSIFGGGGGGGFGESVGADPAASYGLDWAMSDVRAKDDVRQIGELDSGLPVVAYRYKGSRLPQIGVIAQDVEKVAPHAVRMGADGFKRVSYEAVSRLPPARRGVSRLPAMKEAA